MCHTVETLDWQQFLLRLAALIRGFRWGNNPAKRCVCCGQETENKFTHHSVVFHACPGEGGSQVRSVLDDFCVGGGFMDTQSTGVFAWHPDMGTTLPSIAVDIDGGYKVLPFGKAIKCLPTRDQEELFDSMKMLSGHPPSGKDEEALRAVIFGGQPSVPTKSPMAVSGWSGAVDAVRGWVATLVAPQA